MIFPSELRIIALFLIGLSTLCNGYRLLAIFPYMGKSHDQMLDSFARALAERGHEVDVITHFPAKNPPNNYKCVVNLAGTMNSIVNNISLELAKKITDDFTQVTAEHFGNKVCDLLSSDKMQKFIKNLLNNHHYDALVTEGFTAHCFMGIGHLLNIPVIQLVTCEYPWILDYVGNGDNPAFVPTFYNNQFLKMTFWERLGNLFQSIASIQKFYRLTYDKQTAIMRKYISPKLPDIREIERSVALTLINTHPFMYNVKPHAPAVVEVAGLHIEGNTDKFSPELKDWMDQSKHGVIYFSFGSLLVVESLPTETFLAIYRSLRKIAPIRVLIKVTNKEKLPPGLPENVHLLPWIPQVSVLAHNNTVAFISHGGLMSILEAMYFGVPLIGIPIAADQFRNVAALVVKNLAYELNIYDLKEETFNAALNAIINDDTYRKSAKYYSKLFRDRPMNATETAIFWTEYVIRNGPVLRSSALNYSWWQLILLDIYAFIFFCLIVLLYLTKIIFKLILKTCLALTVEKSHRNKKND